MGTYVITEACVGVKDGSCVEVCPVACIHTTPDSPQYYIDPEVCIECEQCEIVCPVDAIFKDVDLPEHLADALGTNAAFFEEAKPPSEPVSKEEASRILEALAAFGNGRGLRLAAAVVDTGGRLLADFATDPDDVASSERALASARKAAASGVRSSGVFPVFEGMDVVGGLGVAGDDREQSQLAARVGLATFRSH